MVLKMKEEIENISITEVADLVGVNVWTIRFWLDRLGMLKPYRNHRGDLFFSPEVVEKIKIICDLSKKKEMNLKEVKQYLDKL